MTTTANSQFGIVQERGWRRGFGNLLDGEFSGWFKSSRWWKLLLVWLVIINLFMVFMVYAEREAASGEGDGPPIFFMYGIFGGLFVAFGGMIIMQRVIISEKQSGTAAWVLSKPVTRSAFIVSRLVGNTIGILLTAVVVPGVLLYLTLGALSSLGWVPLPGFIGGVIVLCIHAFFWLTLTLMTGTLFDSTGAVIAVPMATYFSLWLLGGMLPGLTDVSPLALAMGANEEAPGLGIALMNGDPVSSWLPLAAAVVLSVIFVAVAIWRFNRQEF